MSRCNFWIFLLLPREKQLIICDFSTFGLVYYFQQFIVLLLNNRLYYTLQRFYLFTTDKWKKKYVTIATLMYSCYCKQSNNLSKLRNCLLLAGTKSQFKGEKS